MSGNSEPKPVKRSRLKRWLQNLALMGGVFLFCFLILEVVLRIAGYGNVEIYAADPQLFWKLKPNQDCYTKIDHKPVHVNSRGTRGPEFDVPKPAGTLRILSLGDSKTFGWGLSEAETYSSLVEKMLQEYVGPARRVEVINAGVNAWSYGQMQVYVREYGLKYQPDILVLGDANLWTQFGDNNSPEFVAAFLRLVRLKNFLRRFATYHFIVEYKLQKAYQRTKARFVPLDPKQDTFFKEQQKEDPDAFFRDKIESICQLALSNRIQPVLLFMPTVDQLAGQETPQALRAKTFVRERLGVPLIDTTADLKPQGAALFLEGDLVHLNVPGNELVARRLFQTLTNLVTR